MRKIIINFFILALFLQIVNAETQIFSGKVITDTDKAIEGGIFRFTYDDKSNKVFVQTPFTNLIVDNGFCKSNAVFKVCINRANFSHKNITTYVYYYEIDATIYKLTGSLSASGKVVLNKLLPSETTDFSISIKNPTDFDITNIFYQQNFTGFTLANVKGCEADENRLSWQGSLYSKYDKVCTATIIADKEGAYSLAGSLSYFNGYENEKKSTDTISITVLPRQLKTTHFITKDVEVKRPFYINISLQNIHKDEKIDGTTTIEIPNGINLVKNVEGFSRDFNILKQNFVLEPSSFKNYSFYLEATSETDKPIKQTFDYSIKTIRDKIENNTFVNPLEPKPIINFSSELAELTPGKNFIVIAKIKNPSKIHSLADIEAKLNAPFNDEIVRNLDKLLPNESYTIISNVLSLPRTIPAMDKFTTNLEISYDFYGIKSINKSIDLKVKYDSINIIPPTEPIAEPIKENVSANKTETQQTAQAQSQQVEQNFSQAIKFGDDGQQILTIAEELSLGIGQKSLLFGALIFMAVLILVLASIIIRIAIKIKREWQSEEKSSDDMQLTGVNFAKQKPKRKKISLIILSILLLAVIAIGLFLVRKLMLTQDVVQPTEAKIEASSPEQDVGAAPEVKKEATLLEKLALGALIFMIILGIPLTIYYIRYKKKKKR